MVLAWGYGIAVRTDAGNAKPPPPGSLGELKWDGASGCYMVIDPKQEMMFVLLEQTPSERQRIQRTLDISCSDNGQGSPAWFRPSANFPPPGQVPPRKRNDRGPWDRGH